MKKIDWPMLLLAILVISMFLLVGLAIALRNGWLIGLFIMLGFALMGTGISISRKRYSR